MVESVIPVSLPTAVNIEDVESAAAAPSETGQSTPALPFVGTDVSQDEILAALRSRAPVQFKPVGTTSTVFRLRLAGDVYAAYKPRTHRHPNGHRAEIAAYRIARLLELDNVPPVVFRRFTRDEIHARLDPAAAENWEDIEGDIRWDEDGTTAGAAIYWISRLEELGLDQPAELASWTAALQQASELPGERLPLMRDLSVVVSFDYLIANWDRFSGANMQGDASLGRIFIRDHNVGFRDVSERLQRLMIEKLERTQRFPRSFVERLRTLDRDVLRAALVVPSEGPLLTAAQLEAVLDRRMALLSYIGALREEWGAAIWF